jgi:hypothetical protein
MKTDVYDTYARARNGTIIHFDVLLKNGSTKEQALQHARQFLVNIGEDADTLKQDRCNFCHSEIAPPEVELAIINKGYFILEMEGCPNPIDGTV